MFPRTDRTQHGDLWPSFKMQFNSFVSSNYTATQSDCYLRPGAATNNAAKVRSSYAVSFLVFGDKRTYLF